MRKSLAALLFGATITIGACATVQTPPMRMVPGGHVTDSKFMKGEDSIYFKKEIVNLYGRDFYVERLNSQPEGTLGLFSLNPVDKVLEVRDLDNRTLSLVPIERYVCDKVLLLNGKLADTLVLMDTRSEKTNVEGVKINRTISSKLPRTSQARYGFTAIATETDIDRTSIEWIMIAGEKYFYPHVEDSQTEKGGFLNYYLVPVRGAKEVSDSRGAVRLVNDDKICRPRLYFGDIEAPKKTSGQATEKKP